jgi:hypothetical protein
VEVDRRRETLYRKVIELPPHMAGQDLFLSVGRVDEHEETFFNGTSVGASKSWLFPRGHRIPARSCGRGRT